MGSHKDFTCAGSLAAGSSWWWLITMNEATETMNEAAGTQNALYGTQSINLSHALVDAHKAVVHVHENEADWGILIDLLYLRQLLSNVLVEILNLLLGPFRGS
jgi:hypothetical protein